MVIPIGTRYPVDETLIWVYAWAMKTSIYASVMADLEATKYRWPAIAAATGVSIRTIRKIASREIKDPGVSHIEKLAAYFSEKRSRAA